MHRSQVNSAQNGLISGVALCLLVSLLAMRAAALPWNGRLQLTSLTLAILAGITLGNTVAPRLLEPFQTGIRFSQQRLLRLGVILYGVRLTFQDVYKLGPRAVALDFAVIGFVLVAGSWMGRRVFRLDADTALLISAGSGICGAAAVLATDRVIESEPHKVSVAVATVVVFGTAAMFLYPVLFPLTGFTERQFGIYAGATVHEVAQVVTAGKAVGDTAADTAVITKMVRVLMLAPILILVGRLRRGKAETAARATSLPWFALAFIAVIGAQSVWPLTAGLRAHLIDVDTTLLGSAMFALGLGARWDQLNQAGVRPLLLGATLAAMLIGGGFLLTALFIR